MMLIDRVNHLIVANISRRDDLVQLVVEKPGPPGMGCNNNRMTRPEGVILYGNDTEIFIGPTQSTQ